MRLRAGLWLDDDATLGVELGGLLLEQGGETARFSGGANGANFFGIPFRNARTGEQNIFFVSQNFNDPSISAFLTGQLDISTKMKGSGETSPNVLSLIVRFGGS